MRKRRRRTSGDDVAGTACFGLTDRADLAEAAETAFPRLPTEVVRARPGVSGLPVTIVPHGASSIKKTFKRGKLLRANGNEDVVFQRSQKLFGFHMRNGILPAGRPDELGRVWNIKAGR
jgi:hypothetical protein